MQQQQWFYKIESLTSLNLSEVILFYLFFQVKSNVIDYNWNNWSNIYIVFNLWRINICLNTT